VPIHPTLDKGVDVTPDDFYKHAAKLRKLGATLVRHVTKTSEHQVEFHPPEPKEPDERSPAIGFGVPLIEDDE